MAHTSDNENALAFAISDVCRKTALGRTTIYDAIKEGKLVARKAGRRTVVLAVDLAKFLDELPTVSSKKGDPA